MTLHAEPSRTCSGTEEWAALSPEPHELLGAFGVRVSEFQRPSTQSGAAIRPQCSARIGPKASRTVSGKPPPPAALALPLAAYAQSTPMIERTPITALD